MKAPFRAPSSGLLHEIASVTILPSHPVNQIVPIQTGVFTARTLLGIGRP